jgi:trigger factor
MAGTAHEHTHEHGHTHDHDHDHEEVKLEPKFELQDVGPCKIKIKVEISAEKVKDVIEDKYAELNESVALPGFRKGKAPRNVLERKFGKALLDDIKVELLSQSFEEVKDEKKLEPVGEPDVADVEKLAVEEGKSFSYEVTIEVRPTFEVKNYEGVKVAKPPVAVDEKELEVVLRGFQEQKAELIPAEDGVAKEGDQLIADFQLLVDGKEADKAENTALFLNEDISFYGVELKEFHKAMAGKKSGETVEYPVKLPADFAIKDHAGKDATIKTTVKSLKRKQLPPVDAEFAKKHFDMDSVDELKEHVKKRVQKEKEARARAVMGEKIVEEIVKSNDFPMPEGLIESGAEEAMRRLHVDLAMKGTSEEEIQKVLEKEKGQSKENMAKALKAHFILEHLAQKEKIFVTEDQVEERVGQIASQYGKWPHEMKAYLEEQGLLAQLRRSMREELVREFLLSKAVIEEEKKS